MLSALSSGKVQPDNNSAASSAPTPAPRETKAVFAPMKTPDPFAQNDS
jgi:hypothetical protein